MNLEIYQPEIRMESTTGIYGKIDQLIHFEKLRTTPVIRAFLEDDDLRTMTICSTNIGFVKTLTKYLR